MKRTLVFLLLLPFLLSLPNIVVVANEDILCDTYAFSQAPTDSSLKSCFATSLNEHLFNYFSETYNSQYPNYYAGVYMDDSQTFVIRYTNDSGAAELKQIFTPYNLEKIRDSFFESFNIARNSETIEAYSIEKAIKFQKSEYSLSELRTVFFCLQNYMDDFSISTLSLRQTDNCVYVYTEEASIVEIIDVLNGISHKLGKNMAASVKFFASQTTELASACTESSSIPSEKSRSTSRSTCYIYPGSKIWRRTNTGSSWGTVGFNAYNRTTRKYGLVTAEHCAPVHTTIYDNDWNQINDTIYCNNTTSTRLDASFVPFDDRISNDIDWEPSSNIKLENSSTIARLHGVVQTYAYFEGQTVYKYGNKTGKTEGEILSVLESTATRYLYFRTSCYTQKGDSGGPVLVRVSYDSYDLVGITSFIYHEEGDVEAWLSTGCMPIKPLLLTLDLEVICQNNALPGIGDANRDGVVTSSDSTLILQYYTGEVTFNASQINASDIDMDGEITSTDARLVLMKINGTLPWLT